MTKKEAKKLVRGQFVRLDDGQIVCVSKPGVRPIIGFPAMGGTCPVEASDIVEVVEKENLSEDEQRDCETALMSVERYTPLDRT